MKDFGFNLADAMTFGFEFRLLRRVRLIPEAWLQKTEVMLESLVRRFHIPYLSYAGEFYTGIFQKQA